jgi:hypothetical protein
MDRATRENNSHGFFPSPFARCRLWSGAGEILGEETEKMMPRIAFRMDNRNLKPALNQNVDQSRSLGPLASENGQ